MGCHLYFTANPNEHREFVLKKLGAKRFDYLTIKANTQEKLDLKLLDIWLDKKLEEVGKKDEQKVKEN